MALTGGRGSSHCPGGSQPSVPWIIILPPPASRSCERRESRFAAVRASCPKLEFLSLARTRVSPAALSQLADCRPLRSIDLEGSPFDDRAGQTPSHLDLLEDRRVVGTCVADGDVQSLPQAPGLTSLRLRGTRVTRETLIGLTECHPLRLVDCRGTRITRVASERLRDAISAVCVLCDNL
jgi:hypothetical protein